MHSQDLILKLLTSIFRPQTELLTYVLLRQLCKICEKLFPSSFHKWCPYIIHPLRWHQPSIRWVPASVTFILQLPCRTFLSYCSVSGPPIHLIGWRADICGSHRPTGQPALTGQVDTFTKEKYGNHGGVNYMRSEYEELDFYNIYILNLRHQV